MAGLFVVVVFIFIFNFLFFFWVRISVERCEKSAEFCFLGDSVLQKKKKKRIFLVLFFPENFENRIRKLTSLIIQGKIFVETIFLERFDVKRFFFLIIIIIILLLLLVFWKL